jgi:hypothetical protein
MIALGSDVAQSLVIQDELYQLPYEIYVDLTLLVGIP